MDSKNLSSNELSEKMRMLLMGEIFQLRLGSQFNILLYLNGRLLPTSTSTVSYLPIAFANVIEDAGYHNTAQ